MFYFQWVVQGVNRYQPFFLLKSKTIFTVIFEVIRFFGMYKIVVSITLILRDEPLNPFIGQRDVINGFYIYFVWGANY